MRLIDYGNYTALIKRTYVYGAVPRFHTTIPGIFRRSIVYKELIIGYQLGHLTTTSHLDVNYLQHTHHGVIINAIVLGSSKNESA